MYCSLFLCDIYDEPRCCYGCDTPCDKQCLNVPEKCLLYTEKKLPNDEVYRIADEWGSHNEKQSDG